VLSLLVIFFLIEFYSHCMGALSVLLKVWLAVAEVLQAAGLFACWLIHVLFGWKIGSAMHVTGFWMLEQIFS
jgi:hypothetical protein